MADHRDPADGAGLRRGLAVPCFAGDPADLVELGTGPGWLDAVRDRLGRGPKVQSDRG